MKTFILVLIVWAGWFLPAIAKDDGLLTVEKARAAAKASCEVCKGTGIVTCQRCEGTGKADDWEIHGGICINMGRCRCMGGLVYCPICSPDTYKMFMQFQKTSDAFNKIYVGIMKANGGRREVFNTEEDYWRSLEGKVFKEFPPRKPDDE